MLELQIKTNEKSCKRGDAFDGKSVKILNPFPGCAEMAIRKEQELRNIVKVRLNFTTRKSSHSKRRKLLLLSPYNGREIIQNGEEQFI